MPEQDFLVANIADVLPDGATSPGNPGMLVVGTSSLQSNLATGNGSALWTIFGVQSGAPANATQVVAALQSFSMDYVGDDHHVRNLSVTISSFSGIPSAISGTVVLQDNDGNRQIQGQVTLLLLYLAPYWA